MTGIQRREARRAGRCARADRLGGPRFVVAGNAGVLEGRVSSRPRARRSGSLQPAARPGRAWAAGLALALALAAPLPAGAVEIVHTAIPIPGDHPYSNDWKATSVGDKAVFVNGSAGVLMAFDPSDGSWFSTTFPEFLQYPGVASVGNQVFIAGDIVNSCG